MTSKVLVKLPTVPFPQGKKSSPELLTLPTKNESPAQVRPPQTVSGDRTAQFEQNMKFLQDQHQATLTALHQEVETLRQRNRDLQFQLVFNKSTNCVHGSPSSPEDNSIGFVKTKGSPLCVNVTPLQVELLEKDLDEVKASINEVKKHNQYLLEVIDKQNKKLQQPEKRREKLETADIGVQAGEAAEPIQGDLAARLEDAEAMVKRLRRENQDQQREIATMKATSNPYYPPVPVNRVGRGRTRGPLQTQSYWHGGARGNHSFDQNPDYVRNSRRRHDKQQDRDAGVDGNFLPQLRNSNSKPDSSSYHEEGGDHYRERGNRKFRGARSHRETDSQEHRRDYKDSKDQQRREATTNGTQQPSRKH